MTGKELCEFLQYHPDAEIIIQETSYDDDSTDSCVSAHFYKSGEYVDQAFGEDFSQTIDENGVALVDIVLLK